MKVSNKLLDEDVNIPGTRSAFMRLKFFYDKQRSHFTIANISVNGSVVEPLMKCWTTMNDLHSK